MSAAQPRRALGGTRAGSNRFRRAGSSARLRREAPAFGLALLGGNVLEALTLAVILALAVVIARLAVRLTLARIDAVTGLHLGDFSGRLRRGASREARQGEHGGSRSE